MIKFWKEDFRYIKRSFISFTDKYCYTFSVRGESANYLMNKYGLQYPNIEIHLFTSYNSMSVTSKIDSGLKSDVTDIDDEDDLKELLSILQEEVRIDQVNYEEYMCDSEYNKYDSRWR